MVDAATEKAEVEVEAVKDVEAVEAALRGVVGDMIIAKNERMIVKGNLFPVSKTSEGVVGVDEVAFPNTSSLCEVECSRCLPLQDYLAPDLRRPVVK